MKVGILGTGFGRAHAEVYNKMKDVEIVGIFGRTAEKLRKIEKELCVNTTDRIYTLIEDPHIDLIDVCLPSKVHAKYVLDALKNGKDVFCETPVAYNLNEVLEMKKCAEKYNRKLFVNLFNKFSPPHKYAVEKVRSNELGQPLTVTSYNKTAPIWGNLGLDKIVLNFMIHNFDFITELMGAPNDINASGFDYGKMSHATSSLSYENSFAVVESSSIMPENHPFSIGFEVICEKGAVIYNGQFGESCAEEAILYKENEKSREIISLEESNELGEAILHIINCIKEDKKSPIISIDNAIDSLKIALKVNKSIQ